MGNRELVRDRFCRKKKENNDYCLEQAEYCFGVHMAARQDFQRLGLPSVEVLVGDD